MRDWHIGVVALVCVTSLLGCRAAPEAQNFALNAGGSSGGGGSGSGGGTGTAAADPELTPTAAKFKSVTAGYMHTCGITGTNTVKCWGYGFSGTELGQNAAGPGGIRLNASNVPLPVTGLEKIRALDVGDWHTCVINEARNVLCWGSNFHGQLGVSPATNQSEVPITVPGIANAKQLALGNQVSCALLTDGTVKCWGINVNGRLGNGGVNETPIPVNVFGITTATSLDIRQSHGCVSLADGTVRCWGLNDDGQLGNGTFSSSLTPVTVGGINNAVSVAVGFGHSCALLTDSTVKCWGRNNAGQLGNGNTAANPNPGLVTGVTGVKKLTSSMSTSCVITATNTAQCWGDNFYGQMGNGGLPMNWPNPLSDVQTIDNGTVSLPQVAVFEAGWNSPCYLTATGDGKCWGDNSYNQSGAGSGQLGFIPVPRTFIQ